MSTDSTATLFPVRPIERTDLDRMNLRCWPDRPVIDRLFSLQGTIGMAAWEGSDCVGMLHCYSLVLPQWENPDWPEWNAWWRPGAQPESVAKRDIGLQGTAWAHACFHVGRTLAAARDSDDPDDRYAGRGIGTALCSLSIEWASRQGYVAVLAPGAPADLPVFARWTGHLPWTSYARLGFRAVETPESADLPKWAQGDSPPEVMAEAKAALVAGRTPHDLRDRLMVLELTQSSHGRRSAIPSRSS